MAGAWDVVAEVLGFGDPSGNDHGSSNWAVWGHPEICSMLQATVDPEDIHQAAQAWREQGRRADDLVTGLIRDLNGIVTGGWRGGSADKAVDVLGPINQWSAVQAGVAERTTQLMGASGTSTAQTRAMVPPPVEHDWGESLLSLGAGGVPGVVIDAIAQEHEQSEAHADAVRIMNEVYSAPLNDYRAGIPIHPQLADPTVAHPDPSPLAGPAPGPGQAGAAVAGGGVAGGGAGVGGAPGSPHVLSAPAAPAALQAMTAGDSPTADGGGQLPSPVEPTHRGQHTGGQIAAAAAAAAAGVPVMAPVAASVARRARPGVGGAPFGAGQGAGLQVGGGGRAGGGHAAEFGPRPAIAAEAAEGRMGAGLGHGSAGMAGGRAGVHNMAMPPMAAGRGKGGEDSEHQRASYLIEMDDVFSDGRKVAPAVIGEDPPEHDS